MKDDDQLAALRAQIDNVDEALTSLLNERARLALKIGIAKGTENEVYQPAREAVVLKHVASVGKGPLSDDGLQTIFKTIIAVCRTIQYNK